MHVLVIHSPPFGQVSSSAISVLTFLSLMEPYDLFQLGPAILPGSSLSCDGSPVSQVPCFPFLVYSFAVQQPPEKW